MSKKNQDKNITASTAEKDEYTFSEVKNLLFRFLKDSTQITDKDINDICNDTNVLNKSLLKNSIIIALKEMSKNGTIVEITDCKHYMLTKKFDEYPTEVTLSFEDSLRINRIASALKLNSIPVGDFNSSDIKSFLYHVEATLLKLINSEKND